MNTRIVRIATLIAGVVLGCRTTPVPSVPASPQDAYWAQLQSLCGRAFGGRLTEGAASDSIMRRSALVMHVRSCTPTEMRIPFHVGEDRSRTWVLTRSASGIRLKHDHRHADGTEDSVTQYGGDTRDAGTATRQEYYADAHTAALIPAARTNVWTIDVSRETRLFAYALRRESTDRRVRVEFDLGTAVPTPPAPWGGDCCLELGRQVAERYRVAAINSRRFTHAELWTALEPVVRSSALRVTQFGASIQGRALNAITYGNGPTKVLLWSQMHGDESTATMSLTDLLAWFGESTRAHNDLRDLLATRLTIVMVPMLNPDGAELFQRENAIGIDVNRDARRLSTPEARALKTLRDSLKPSFGFNLHDQNARTLGAPGGRQVGIALLAPAADAEKGYGPTRATARLVAARIRTVLEQEIPGRIAKYDDAFNPRAFGDLVQQWGTSTVLIESGALPDDPEKQRLRTMNVIAILTALEAIVSGGYRAADPDMYESLPVNDRAAVDLLVTGAELVLPGQPPMRVDLALNYEDALRKGRLRVREVGDLAAVVALDTMDVAGMFLHPAPVMLTQQGGKEWLRINALVQLSIRGGREPTSLLVREIGGAER